MLKNKWFRFVLTAVIVCAAVFMLMNGAGLFTDKISAARPESVTVSEYYDAKATVIGGSNLLTVKSGGTVSLDVAEGERVRADTVVATVYPANSDLSAAERASALKEKIASLKALDNGELDYRKDALLLENDINDLLLSITGQSLAGNFSGLSDSADRLAGYFGIKQQLLGELTGLSEKIAALEEQLGSISASVPKATGTISAGAVGYFSSSFDGYEDLFIYDDLTSLSVSAARELLETAVPAEKPDGYIGKTVTELVWRIAVPMPASDAESFYVGREVRILFPSLGETISPAEVVYSESYRDDAIVIFEGNVDIQLFLQARKLDIRILRSSTSCMKVPATALIKNDDGVTGVYVLVAQQVTFKPVNLIRYEDDNVLITPATSGSSKLSAHDEVIVSGKNLFDGKIIG